jgi:hypothetical protein
MELIQAVQVPKSNKTDIPDNEQIIGAFETLAKLQLIINSSGYKRGLKIDSTR